MNSPKKTARLAGLAYLLSGIASLFGFICTPLVQQDPMVLADMITASELRFRIGIMSDLISGICALFLLLLLYQLFSSVNKKQTVYMVILLLVSMPISFTIMLNDVAAQILLSESEFLSSFTKPQLDALAMVFLKLHFHGVFAVEIFWGLWLFPFGFLVIKSGFIPRILGVFLIIAGIAYVVHSFISLMLPGHRPVAYEIVTMVARGAGELPIILWLLIKGRTT